MSDSTNGIDTKLRVFKTLSKHDTLMVLCAIGSIYALSPWLGLAIALFPLLEFVNALGNNKPLSSTIKDKVIEEFPDAKGIIFRVSNELISKAYTVPFFKMVVLSNEDVESYTKLKEQGYGFRADAVIAHEIGHMTQHDRFILRWLQAVIFIFAAVAAIFFITYLVNPLILNWRYIYTPDAFQALFILATVIYLYFSLFKRISHRREHIADLSAVKAHQASMLKYFEYRIRKSNKSKKKHILLRFWKTVTHPHPKLRSAVISEPLSAKDFGLRGIFFQWVALFFFFDTFVMLEYQRITFSTLFFISFFSLMGWTLCRLSMCQQNHTWINRIIIDTAIGLALGLGTLFIYDNAVSYLTELNNFESKLELSKLSAHIYVFFIFALTALGLFFAIHNVKRDWTTKPKRYAAASTILFVISFVVLNLDFKGTLSVIKEYRAQQHNEEVEAPSLKECDNTPYYDSDELKACYQHNQFVITHKLSKLDNVDIDKPPAEVQPLYIRNLNRGVAPKDPSVMDFRPSHATIIEEVKNYIKEWENDTGRIFITDHPSMKIVPIPNNAIVIQPIEDYPYDENYQKIYYEDEPGYNSFVTLAALTRRFDLIARSSENGICRFEKTGFLYPKKAYCGEAYRQWITDVYHAKESLEYFIPNNYMKRLDYESNKQARDQKYQEDLVKYAEDKRIYDEQTVIYKQKLEANIAREKQRLRALLRDINAKLSAL